MKYDWIIDKSDQQQMISLVSADGVERATLLIVPGADHNFGRHLDAQGAFNHCGDGDPIARIEFFWCRKEDYSALRASPLRGRPAADQIGCANLSNHLVVCQGFE